MIANKVRNLKKMAKMLTDEIALILKGDLSLAECNKKPFSDDETSSSFGVITGEVEILSKRGCLKFIIYDSIFDKPVTCFLEKEEELMRGIWGKQVAVVGLITRDSKSGRPLEIHDVKRVEIVKDAPGSYKSAYGIIPYNEGEEPSEILIRRLRDDN